MLCNASHRDWWSRKQETEASEWQASEEWGTNDRATVDTDDYEAQWGDTDEDDGWDT